MPYNPVIGWKPITKVILIPEKFKYLNSKNFEISNVKLNIKKGQKIGKLARVRGIKLSKRVKTRAKKTVSKKITKAKRMIRSSDDNVELIKKLGELKKAGIITSKEFQTKKKQLLDKI